MNPSSTIDYFSSNTNFDKLYPLKIQQLSSKHWSPLAVAQKAAAWLAEVPNSKILDIGSGVGKFCLIAAHQFKSCEFVGVEQRKELVKVAETAAEALNLKNVAFIHAPFTKIDFNQFKHFYFYNSFYENQVEDEDFLISENNFQNNLYERFTNDLLKRLKERPMGTKIATYQSDNHEIPFGYELVESHFNGKLNFWIKK